MTPLRLQMIEDMKSAGLAPRTQAVYIDAVRRLAGHYRRSPDRLTEDKQVRALAILWRGRAASVARSGVHHGWYPTSSTAGRWIAIGRCFGKIIRPPKPTPSSRGPVLSDEQVPSVAGRR